MKSPRSALVIDAVTKVYRRRATAANRGITLRLEGGQLLALIGHNGAGKTTLLNQVVGTTRPTSGDIRYGDRSLVADPAWARRVASLMPQMHAPLAGVTPRQAITAVGCIRGSTKRVAVAAADELLEALDIAPWAGVAGEKLSGGMRRLTSYAMAVTCPPPVLLIDEPTNDVDPIRRPKVWRHLNSLARAGHIVIVVTHNLLEVERVADRVVLLQHGQVRLDASRGDLTELTRLTTLTVSLRDPHAPLPATPSAVAVGDGDGLLRLSLAPSQVSDAVDWVLGLVSAGVAVSYTVGPASLETLYDEVTHAQL